MLCVEAEVAPMGCRDCSIYLEDETSNHVAGHAVEMLGYGRPRIPPQVRHQVVRPEFHLPDVPTRFVYVS